MVRALIAALSLAAGATLAAQGGGVTLHSIPGRPGIDGRAWMLVDPYTGAQPIVRPGGADYELRFSDRTDEGGAVRWTVMLDRGGRQVALTGGAKTAFVYVTPDTRYIIVEPLTVVDTVTGERHTLDAGAGMKIVAVAQDGHRLFVERADGEPFELVLPD